MGASRSIMGWRWGTLGKDMGPVEVLWDGDGVNPPPPPPPPVWTDRLTPVKTVSRCTTYAGGKKNVRLAAVLEWSPFFNQRPIFSHLILVLNETGRPTYHKSASNIPEIPWVSYLNHNADSNKPTITTKEAIWSSKYVFGIIMIN